MVEPDRAPLDRDLDAMTGDPRLSRVAKESLERLRAGVAGPEMAEMARELLDGRIKLRSLADNSVYGHVLLEGVEKYRRWESDLNQEERRQLGRTVRETYGKGTSPSGLV